MSQQPFSKPLSTDLVLGNRQEPESQLDSSLILGGIQGVQQRYYQAKTPIQKIEVLKEAINQGQQGLDLVIRSIKDKTPEIHWAAYELLSKESSSRAKLAIQLFSAQVNYQKLEELLKGKNWYEADLWTIAILYHLTGADNHRALTKFQIANCDCRDLLIIDRLWQKLSNGRFGFNVQAKIWKDCASSLWDPGEVWLLYGKKVKWYSSYWLRHEELNFNYNAAQGHLPYAGGIFTLEAIANRLIQCKNEGQY
jgi:GUN4-like